MKNLIALFLVSFVLTPVLLSQTIKSPTPQIFILNDQGTFISAPGVMGVSPYQIHVSAISELPTAQCYWDPTAWRNLGEHNICSEKPYSIKNLPASAGDSVFSKDPSKLKNPQNVEGGIPSACFEALEINFDAASTELVKDLTDCVRARDIAFDIQNSNQLLGGGSLVRSTFSWDFGDAGSLYNQVRGFNAAHIYDTAGNKKITLTVTNEAGLSASTSITVNVQPGNRLPVLINSDADLQKLNVSQGVPQGRRIAFKSGATFHLPWSLALFTNDRVTSDGALPAILIPASNSTVFAPHSSSHVLVENLKIEGDGTSWLATGYGNNHAYRGLQFEHLTGAFQPGNSGILIENCGMPHAADGSWQSNHLQANFIIHSVKALSFYGNHAYLLQSDGNREPAIRANAAHLISMIGNEIGGWTGKNDQVSMRGSKFMYFGNNQMRGGVFNVQQGDSPNPQPGAMFDNIVMENNTLENLGFETRGLTPNIEIRNNLFHLHADSEAAYNALYPRPNPHHLTINAGAENIFVEKNALQLDESNGSSVVFYGAPKGLHFTGNRVLSPLLSAIRTNGTGFTPFSEISGNVYFFNAGISIADMGLKSDTLLHWNANVLSNGNKVSDVAVNSSNAAPMIHGELQLP